MSLRMSTKESFPKWMESIVARLEAFDCKVTVLDVEWMGSQLARIKAGLYPVTARMAGELSDLRTTSSKLFDLGLLEIDTSMTSFRNEDYKFQGFCYDLYVIGETADRVHKMIDECSIKLDIAIVKVKQLEDHAALAAEKKKECQGKLDAKIKSTEKTLKAVKRRLNQHGVESEVFECFLKKKAHLQAKLRNFKTKKKNCDEELKDIGKKMMEMKAELHEEENKHTFLLGVTELSSTALKSCRESMEVMQQVICLRLKALSKKLLGTKIKIRYMTLTELADSHILEHICNNVKSFHHFSLKFVIANNFHNESLGPLSQKIQMWSNNDIVSVSSGKVYRISVKDEVVKFSTLSELEAHTAGYKI